MSNTKSSPQPPATPMLDKMREVRVKSQAIGEFLEWLQGDQRIQLVRYHEHTDKCLGPDDDPECSEDHICGLTEDSEVPEHRSIERLLADFFEIDLDVAETERRTLLDWMRSSGALKHRGEP